MFQKVLVPLDGSEMAEGILPYVTQLAKGLDIPIVLLSVIDPHAVELPERLRAVPGAVRVEYGPSAPSQPSAPARETGVHPHEPGGPVASQVFERVQLEVKRRLEEVARQLQQKGVKAQTVVTFGKPAEVIVQTAEHEGCNLIAMSTHGRNALGRGILGSVTDKVIHSSHLPTLTITPDRAKQYWHEGDTITNIMVPLDGSPLAETILPYVEDMAKKMSLEVILVRVATIGGLYSAYADGYPYIDYAELEKEVETEATDYLKGVAERLKAEGLKVEWKLLRGAPSTSILDVAHETAQDMVALTTHGRSGVTRWVLGSVAEALVRASGHPVLVVPPDQTGRGRGKGGVRKASQTNRGARTKKPA